MRLMYATRWLLAALLFYASFGLVTKALYERPRPPPSAEMEIVVPALAQLVTVAGDRYLAANMGAIRALVAWTETMTEENFRVLGLVQSDVSKFNPAHEDNYYIAAAILPWYGQFDAAQFVLRRASEARPFDWQPAFYHGFNEFHFRKDALAGAEWLRIAATQTRDEMDQLQLQQLAAQWVNRASDRGLSVHLLRTMARETNNKPFARFLEKRATRLENIALIDQAVSRYRERQGALPERLSDLVQSGFLAAFPEDPFSMRYGLGAKGDVVILPPDTTGKEGAR